jgi:hypothetical protein
MIPTSPHPPYPHHCDAILAWHPPSLPCPPSCKEEEGKIKHSRYRKDFFRTLSIEESRHQYRKIPRCTLIPLKQSPWQKLLALQNDQAYITMLGINCNSFDWVLKKFAPMFSGHTSYDKSGMIVELVKTQGQKREIQPKDCIGLVLLWMRTRGLLNVLQLILGLTYSNLSLYLRFGMRLIVETFRNDPLARVGIPSAEEIETFKAAFAERQPLLNDCWATMDGLKLYLQTARNADIQEPLYNG